MFDCSMNFGGVFTTALLNCRVQPSSLNFFPIGPAAGMTRSLSDISVVPSASAKFLPQFEHW